MRAVLVRVAVDHSYGNWNGPVDPATNDFVYVSIPDTNDFRAGLETPYALVVPALAAFAAGRACKSPIVLPIALSAGNMHLDPDFKNLTYGDKKQRAREFAKFEKGDVVVFYSGLRPSSPCPHNLVYAIIGLFRVNDVVRLADVPAERWHENAHTRRVKTRLDDVIVRGQAESSGRLKKCIPIGEWRSRAYRVRNDLLDAWGGISCKDGYIQRSAVPPTFLDAPRFMRWFEKQTPELVAENNPGCDQVPALPSNPVRVPAMVAKKTAAPAKTIATTTPRGGRVAAVGDDRVIVVMLRRPRKQDPRKDPFFEYGSFGLTGCHRTNLLADNAAAGCRLAFAQGGKLGFRLVMLTPIVDVREYSDRHEAFWSPNEMPLKYTDAPLLIGRGAATDVHELIDFLTKVKRSTWEARFASAFRSRKRPVSAGLAAALTGAWNRGVEAAGSRAEHYWQALPWRPDVIDVDRHSSYASLRDKALGGVAGTQRSRPRRGRTKRSGRRC